MYPYITPNKRNKIPSPRPQQKNVIDIDNITQRLRAMIPYDVVKGGEDPKLRKIDNFMYVQPLILTKILLSLRVFISFWLCASKIFSLFKIFSFNFPFENQVFSISIIPESAKIKPYQFLFIHPRFSFFSLTISFIIMQIFVFLRYHYKTVCASSEMNFLLM